MGMLRGLLILSFPGIRATHHVRELTLQPTTLHR